MLSSAASPSEIASNPGSIGDTWDELVTNVDETVVDEVVNFSGEAELIGSFKVDKKVFVERVVVG